VVKSVVEMVVVEAVVVVVVVIAVVVVLVIVVEVAGVEVVVVVVVVLNEVEVLADPVEAFTDMSAQFQNSSPYLPLLPSLLGPQHALPLSSPELVANWLHASRFQPGRSVGN